MGNGGQPDGDTALALIQGALAALEQPATFPADIALARARLRAAVAQLTAPGATTPLILSDGDDTAADERAPVVVPAQLSVDASSVVQLPSLLAVTVEHYAGQVRVYYWSPEDAMRDPTFQDSVAAPLAATAPTD